MFGEKSEDFKGVFNSCWVFEGSEGQVPMILGFTSDPGPCPSYFE